MCGFSFPSCFSRIRHTIMGKRNHLNSDPSSACFPGKFPNLHHWGRSWQSPDSFSFLKRTLRSLADSHFHVNMRYFCPTFQGLDSQFSRMPESPLPLETHHLVGRVTIRRQRGVAGWWRGEREAHPREPSRPFSPLPY
jgi:hypothetical protein